jgi:TPR repeat protein
VNLTLGNPDAQFSYGVCLAKGKGVEHNMAEAARYFKMSADQAHSHE